MSTRAVLNARDIAEAPIAAPNAARERIADDRAMLRAAAELSRDLHPHKPLIYWSDLLVSLVIGYGAMFVAATAGGPALGLAAGFVSALAIYRAVSFIHEIAHMKPGAVPGFRLGWNLLVGVPLFVPSFMYEDVHVHHHARTKYGTVEDPEYLPLALMKPWTLPMFVIVAALAPAGLMVRYGLLTPLSALIPTLRRHVIERYSGLVINPAYRRRMPEGRFRREWLLMEAGACLWALTLILLVVTAVIPLKAFLIPLAIISAATVINQVRTLVAHLWENEGDAMSVTAQYLDSVNVPPPALLPGLWAPVGLRYHALHHLLPSVPYHALGEAHRRIAAALEQGSIYHKASYGGLPGLLGQLARSTMVKR
ncbi:fatty acid desaturase [Sphingomonas sp.]|uniref:fatty acid desaturase family protein n=1 Tax=Sphingomonas sp. TaxID=28214 RepID=UPI002EDA5884